MKCLFKAVLPQQIHWPQFIHHHFLLNSHHLCSHHHLLALKSQLVLSSGNYADSGIFSGLPGNIVVCQIRFVFMALYICIRTQYKLPHTHTHTHSYIEATLDPTLSKSSVQACGFHIFNHIEPVAVILEDVRKSNEQLLRRTNEIEREISALQEEASNVPGSRWKKVAPSKGVWLIVNVQQVILTDNFLISELCKEKSTCVFSKRTLIFGWNTKWVCVCACLRLTLCVFVTARFTTADQVRSWSHKLAFRVREPTFLSKLKRIF